MTTKPPKQEWIEKAIDEIYESHFERVFFREEIRDILRPFAQSIDERGVERERERINTPQTVDWLAAVPMEAAHQQGRWPAEGDAGKTPFDWFWLIGFLAQKAADAHLRGDRDKARHHTISTGAALLNWHRHISGEITGMRPGIATPENLTPPPSEGER